MRCRPAVIALVIAACSKSDLTGVEITLRYEPSLQLDQIAISGKLDDGAEAFAPGRAPEPPRLLLDGEDTLVLLLREDLSGRTINLLVEGMSRESLAAEGRASVRVAAREIVGAGVDLNPIEMMKPDAGVDAGEDAEPDAGEDADTPPDSADAEPPDADDAEAPDAPEDAQPIDAEPDAGCTPIPEVVADGIDQNCDGFDDCYADVDNDGFGSSTVITDGDLDCSNASALTSIVATDCDDNEDTVHPGTVCDDGSESSNNDVCLGPVCRGWETSGCGNNCSSCSAGSCCARACPSGNCPSCTPGCSCDLDCDGSSDCTATCQTGSVCHVFINSGNDGTMTCEDGASCDLRCNSTTNCHLECVAGAYCIISMCNSSGCTLGCTGAAMSCPGGEQTCNRTCP